MKRISAAIMLLPTLLLSAGGANGAEAEYVCGLPINVPPEVAKMSSTELKGRLIAALTAAPARSAALKVRIFEIWAPVWRKANPAHLQDVDLIVRQEAGRYVDETNRSMASRFQERVIPRFLDKDLPELVSFYENPQNSINNARITQLEADPSSASKVEAREIERCSAAMLKNPVFSKMAKLASEEGARDDPRDDQLVNASIQRINQRMMKANLKLPNGK